MAEQRSRLVYDGDCGICRYWVRYWQGLTGERVVYRPYQQAAAEFPAIPAPAFPRAIQLIEPDGKVYSGAAATYRVLRQAPGRRPLWWLYLHLPGFSSASELGYAFLSRRRGWLNGASRLLWGPALEAERYTLVSWVFLRLFGAIYVAAFASLGVQILGLVGQGGILPLANYLRAAHLALGGEAYRALPTLFWLDPGDGALLAGTVLGVVLGLLVIVDRWTRPALIALFVLYLSYFYAGQDFTSFQWDLLLLEAGFLAVFLTGGSRIVVWLYRWLVFRYLFMAGTAKLVSGDATWREGAALDYHFWTQPLPTPLAWYAAQLPHWLLAAGTAATLLVEVGSVFLVFLPRRPRALAACCVLSFQSLILLTGNYNFFNLLTMLMCLFLFDDAALRNAIPSRLQAWAQKRTAQPGRMATMIATALALVVVPVGLNELSQMLARKSLPLAGELSRVVAPLMIVNPYGLFAVMTTTRPEIVIEGSEDGGRWREYVFRYKPGPLTRPPLWNIPHQPRLDWQMWFAALNGVTFEPWFPNLMLRLLQGSPSVLDLFDSNPFPHGPPKFVRATLYDYRFANRAIRATSGQWWVRQPEGPFFPQVSLRDFKHAE